MLTHGFSKWKGDAHAENTMTEKGEATPNAVPTEVRLTAAEAADAVRAKRQAVRAAKAAAAQAKVDARKVGMSHHAARQKNALGIAASASKASAVSRAIVSRGRGGRKR